jgi:hypothetical protein
MVTSPVERLAECGDYWESLGGVWGGRKGADPVHFEYPGFQAALAAQGGQEETSRYSTPAADEYRALVEKITGASSFVGSFFTPILPSIFVTLAPSVQKKELNLVRAVATQLAEWIG